MFRLDIKVSKIVTHKTYSRLAAPVLHSWTWKNIALSESKQALKDYAESLPLESFYWYEREYRIETGANNPNKEVKL